MLEELERNGKNEGIIGKTDLFPHYHFREVTKKITPATFRDTIYRTHRSCTRRIACIPNDLCIGPNVGNRRNMDFVWSTT